MLIGAHVSPAGGLPKAIDRGVERDCDSIQIFNQSPRAWKPTQHADEAVAAFIEARRSSRIGSVLIHAVYLLNCASDDPELAAKSRQGLINALATGDRIGADAVVLHPGSAKKGDPVAAIARAGAVIADALASTGKCQLHLENTAGAGGTLGRSFAELASLIEAAGGHERLGVCIDSCHLFASGYDVSTREGLDSALAECESQLGIERLRSIHVNDSMTELGSNRDRHAPPGEGLIGPAGLANFLSEPRFEGLPVILEGPGTAGAEAELVDVLTIRGLRERGLRERNG